MVGLAVKNPKRAELGLEIKNPREGALGRLDRMNFSEYKRLTEFQRVELMAEAHMENGNTEKAKKFANKMYDFYENASKEGNLDKNFEQAQKVGIKYNLRRVFTINKGMHQPIIYPEGWEGLPLSD